MSTRKDRRSGAVLARSQYANAATVDSRGTGPILVTFGGNGFDLPLLRYRAIALGAAVTAITGIASARRSGASSS
jgi:hypothetical protein